MGDRDRNQRAEVRSQRSEVRGQWDTTGRRPVAYSCLHLFAFISAIRAIGVVRGCLANVGRGKICVARGRLPCR